MQILLFWDSLQRWCGIDWPIIPSAKQNATVLLTKIARLATGLRRRKNEEEEKVFTPTNLIKGISNIPNAPAVEARMK
jgi:hypothetical protein